MQHVFSGYSLRLKRSFVSCTIPSIYMLLLCFTFYFSQRISSQSATVLFITLSSCLLGATVLYAFPVAFFASLNCKYPALYAKFSLCFSIYLNFACLSLGQTCKVLGFYPSRVCDRCLMRCRVNNHVSVKEWATMRCFRQVRMTLAPLMTKGIHANSPSMEEDEDLDVDGSKGD